MEKLLSANNHFYCLSLRRMGLLLSCLILINSAQATTFIVSSTANDGPGSLRQAILNANANLSATPANPHFIVFALPLGSTITLSSPFLVITNHVTIQGPGQDQLTISGNNATRIFWLQNGSITIRALTLSS